MPSFLLKIPPLLYSSVIYAQRRLRRVLLPPLCFTIYVAGRVFNIALNLFIEFATFLAVTFLEICTGLRELDFTLLLCLVRKRAGSFNTVPRLVAGVGILYYTHI